MATAARPAQRAVARPGPWREVALIAVLYVGYRLGRLAATGHVALAYRNADRVWGLERMLRVPDETDIQRLLLLDGTLVQAANTFYAYVHFPATAAFLLWMYLFRPADYRWARRALATLTAAALLVHLVFPLAPPRMLAVTGLIDTAARYGPSVYGAPQTDTLSNQYAAMPTLHVGWALVVAIGLITTTRSRWRWLWLAHPAITTLVVVGTANHYWLDAVVVGMLLAGVLGVLGRPHRSSVRLGVPSWLRPRPIPVHAVRLGLLRWLRPRPVAVRAAEWLPTPRSGEVVPLPPAEQAPRRAAS